MIRSLLVLTLSVTAFASALKAQAPTEVVLAIDATKNPMLYDKSEFTAKAGSKLKIVVDNVKGQIGLPHNIVICAPGSSAKVVQMSMMMMADPNGLAKAYVPEIPEVLYKMPFVQPGQKGEIEITVPAEAGEYPYICTFVGHAAIMKGVMKVEK